MFADKAIIEVRAGKGGDGALSFRHEKYRAMGGPDGGDGGRGGDVVLRVDHNMNSLSSYRTARRIEAAAGQAGGGNRRHGKNGQTSVIALPAGTQVWEGETLLADLTKLGDEVVIAKGGRGGFGNAHFTASARQAPRTAELGEPGEAHSLRLELKMVAEIGFVGLPNAGKSTLLSVITNAKPEIGDYAFTTLIPNLGMIDHRGFTFLAADIPGLIEGASTGKGLGDEFLRHIERTAVLLQLVDGLSEDVVADWRTLEAELAAYGHGLIDKPRLTVLTKIEALTEDELAAKLKTLKKVTGSPVFAISAQAHRGLTELLDAAAKLVKTARTAREAAEAEAPVITLENFAGAPDVWHVTAESEGKWRVTGERIEGFARRTNFDSESDDGVIRLRDILRKTGVARELRRQGAEPGDQVYIGEAVLEWTGE
jgi:GTPase